MSPTTTQHRDKGFSSDTPLQTWIGFDGEPSRVADQLHKHLADMSDLCAQVKDARGDCHERGEAWCDLFDELIETLEQHQSMIAEQLSDMHHSEEADAFFEDATCVR